MLRVKNILSILLAVNALFLVAYFINATSSPSPSISLPVNVGVDTTNALAKLRGADEKNVQITKDSDSKDDDNNVDQSHKEKVDDHVDDNVDDKKEVKKDDDNNNDDADADKKKTKKKDDDGDDKETKKEKKTAPKKPKQDKKKKPAHSKTHKKGTKEAPKKKVPKKPKISNKEQARKANTALKKIVTELTEMKSSLDEANKRIANLTDRTNQVGHVLRWNNPFFLLGAYPRVGNEYFNSYPEGRPKYEVFNYGVINDEDYCEIVDMYNLAHPENMFDTMNFFTDYSRTGLTRAQVIRKIGVDNMRQVSRYMNKSDFKSAQYHLSPLITNYFTKRVDMHIYHEIGKHIICATQMYNHIPGHGVLKRKDLIVDSVDSYAARFEGGREHCFNKKTFFPYSYRLYMENECKAFWEHVNSKEYIKSLKKEPIQFVIKLGYGAHRAKGVFIFDKNETEEWREFYDNGNLCGIENKSIIAQTYITNPLVLDLNNKFDFRVYMLVASTNPLIVYYHDGFLRVSLSEYNKHSSDKNVHLTNTHLSKEIFAEAEANNKTILGMTADELRDYQMWTFERLGNYLYKSGQVDDANWVENKLKPEFYQAFIHTVRMSAHAFWNQSNVYEMYGLDFMLDDELNLWFIECNSSPQLIGTNDQKTKFLINMLTNLFEIQYGLYRSRMQRVLHVLKRMSQERAESGAVNYGLWRSEYAAAAKNRFEPEYKISPDNSFKLIMDLNLEGPDAYFGHLPDECTY